MQMRLRKYLISPLDECCVPYYNACTHDKSRILTFYWSLWKIIYLVSLLWVFPVNFRYLDLI